MELHLGYLQDFKRGDAVLVSGEPPAIERLADIVEGFGRGDLPLVRLDEAFEVQGGQRLALVRDPETRGAEFTWLVRAPASTVLADMLRNVARGGPAHQYFDLLHPSAQLIVSVGEYPSEWWQAHG